jgi:hypothetical protein
MRNTQDFNQSASYHLSINQQLTKDILPGSNS